jgi:thiamine biosynthesis lipoprotein
VIDVGAAGKGYLVDIVSAILQQAGVARFVIDAGGDLRHCGEHGIRVGLEHPLDPRLVIGVANLQNRALCASADGLATALFFTGPHRLAQTHRFAYVRMLADGRAERSPNFDGELFTAVPSPSRRLPSSRRPIAFAQRQGRT